MEWTPEHEQVALQRERIARLEERSAGAAMAVVLAKNGIAAMWGAGVAIALSLVSIFLHR